MRLGRVAELISGIDRPLDRELNEARAELANLAVGIHPSVLSERGLGAALEQLAARSPVAVTVTVDEARLPPPVESALYFVSSEALANIVLETADPPLLVSNVDLTEARIGGLGTDVARRFLERFAEGAGLTLHVRLLNGKDSQHVLEAIFKALGVALAQACTDKGAGSG